MRRAYVLTVAAALIALVIAAASEPLAFEERLIRIEASYVSPELAAQLRGETLLVQAAMLDLAGDPLLLLKARAALMRYPQMTREVLAIYAEEPEFREILRAYGESVIPPIYYFLHNEVRTVAFLHYAAHKLDTSRAAISRFWRREQVAQQDSALEAGETADDGDTASNELTPEQRGWYAVNFIRDEGYDFIGQFVLNADGEPRWVQTERFLEGAGSLLAGGFRTLEAKIVSDQELMWADAGWAAVDVLAVVGTLKLVRIGKVATASGRSYSITSRSAAVASRLVRAGQIAGGSARYAKWPAIVGTAYVVVKHPSLVSDALAGVARLAGLPAWPVLMGGWILILLPVLYLLAFVAKLAAPLLRLLRRLSARRPRRLSHTA